MIAKQLGRVACATREHYLLWTNQGEVSATLSGHLRRECRGFPCVGDWVEFTAANDTNTIQVILPRRSQLSRKEPGSAKREQVLASNLDVLFIVSGLDGDYNPRRLERYLVTAWNSGARPVVVLNKADILPSEAANDRQREAESLAPGARVFLVSAITGQGMEALAAHVQPNETAALIGSSGAGKSTIVNRLLAHEQQTTQSVRKGSKGRHTTVRRELFRMPGGWFLMDLPGLREVQLWADAGRVDDTFAEIAELSLHCKFRNCRHETETGCAVRGAELDTDRLTNYRKLQREVDYLEREADPQRAREERQRWNALEKNMRKHPKRIGF